jgi:hypothetical protein
LAEGYYDAYRAKNIMDTPIAVQFIDQVKHTTSVPVMRRKRIRQAADKGILVKGKRALGSHFRSKVPVLVRCGEIWERYERNMGKTAGLYAQKCMGRLRQALMGNARLVSGP